jgi:tetratricopeptide (TPR) repeat protein
MKKTCFVIMGYGIKTDFESGRDINLDKSYTSIIKPVFKKLGIKCFRSSDLKQSGVIDVKMYEHIMKADLVIADISTLNVNAIYELGIRHALRPNTTIVLCEDELLKNKRLPFDINHLTIHPYKHHGEVLDHDEVKRFKKYLRKLITHIIEEPTVDSPVYTFLPNLRPPSFTEEELKEIFEIEDSTNTISKLLEIAEEKKDKKEYTEAVELLEKALSQTPNQNDSFIIQRIALNTYKSEKPNKIDSLKLAKEILRKLGPNHTTDPETLGLMGSINKRLYEEVHDEIYLNKSIHYYERGYYVKQDYYNGINVAFLYSLKASLSNNKFEIYSSYGQALKIWKGIISKWEPIIKSSNFKERGDKEWVYFTLAEACFGIKNFEMEKKYLKKGKEIMDGDFALQSYNEQNNKLKEIVNKLETTITV